MLELPAVLVLVAAIGAGVGELIFEDDFERTPDDLYTAVGNTTLVVGGGSIATAHVRLDGSVLDNDAPFLAGQLSVQSFDSNSSAGGSASLAADGTFRYEPPTGFNGVDTFGYTATNGSATIDATVEILIVERVWYVSGNGPAGDGTSISPFNTLVDVAGPGGAGDSDDRADHIYLHAAASAYPGGIELEPEQRLIGEGVTLTVSGFDLTVPGARPIIENVSGAAITLADAVAVRGLDVDGAATVGVLGENLAQSLDLTQMSIRNTNSEGLVFRNVAGRTWVGEVSIAGSGQSGVVVDDVSGELVFDDVSVSGSGDHGFQIANAEGVTIDFCQVNETAADGIHIENSNVDVLTTRIGEQGTIGDDGLDIVNSSGTHAVSLIFNNVFGLGVADPIGRGISINVTGGELDARLDANFIASDNQTVFTADSGLPASLRLILQGNSTLSTNNPGVPTMEFIGGGLHSTIVRAWDSPNQVIGGQVDMAGGIVFRQVTFDSDAVVANGFQQVVFDGGALDIGQVPPFTIQRVSGDGLRFDDPAGSLRIDTLNIANDGGFGLFVDPAAVNNGFVLDIGERTINTINGTESNFP